MLTKSACRPLLTIAILLTAVGARANSISITGNSETSSQEIANSLIGGGLSIYQTTETGPFVDGQFAPGSFVNFRGINPFYSTLQGVPGNSITFGTKSTDLFAGGLIFTTSFVAPTLANDTTVTLTLPVTMVGNVVAYMELGGGVAGPALFGFGFKGTGTASITILSFGGIDYITSEFYTYSGTAFATPEPSSIVLLGTGLAGIMVGLLAKSHRGRLSPVNH